MKTEQELRKIKKRNTYILWIVGYLIISFICIHMGAVFNSYKHFDIMCLAQYEKDVIYSMKTTPFFIPELQDLKILWFISLLYLSAFLYCQTFNKKYRLGKEHGSTQWAEKKDIEKLVDKDSDYNMILTQTEQVSLNTRLTKKNNNTILIGSPGTGKTRYYVKPNILQANCSYVITDPKGELLEDTGEFFLKHDYKLKILNLKDMSHSMCYNPFAYIEKETDVIKVIDCLITNTNKTQSNSDPFWEKAEIALLQAIFFYIYYEIVDEEHNFKSVMELLRMAEAKEDDENFQSDLDIIFEQLSKEKPNHIACKQYKIFKMGAGKTIKSILISLGVRLSVFNINAVSNLMMKDELELNTIGDEKTALFVVIPDATDSTFNFIAAMMYTQLFDTLYKVADSSTGKRLKYHTRCILDEFANIGKIPNFDKLITTMRSREISVAIIIQAMSQLKEMYEKNWEGLAGTCEYLLFLGSQEQTTLEYISKRLGKETIDTRNINNTKGKQGSTSWNYGNTGRELMAPDEIGRMPDEDCILIIRGLYPFYSKKYNLQSHRNYKYLADSTNTNKFSYTKFRQITNEKESENEREKLLEHFNIEDFTLEQNELEYMFSNYIKSEEMNSTDIYQAIYPNEFTIQELSDENNEKEIILLKTKGE